MGNDKPDDKNYGSYSKQVRTSLAKIYKWLSSITDIDQLMDEVLENVDEIYDYKTYMTLIELLFYHKKFSAYLLNLVKYINVNTIQVEAEKALDKTRTNPAFDVAQYKFNCATIIRDLEGTVYDILRFKKMLPTWIFWIQKRS